MLIGLDARGFIIAPALALRLNVRFIPVRKKGKLPGPTMQAKYEKEYGSDIFEMQMGRLTEVDRVVVVDDLIATGGSPLPPFLLWTMKANREVDLQRRWEN